MKKYLIFLFLVIYVDANNLVLKAAKNIQYKNLITKSDIVVVYSEKSIRSCNTATKQDIINNHYRAKIFIKKGRVICKRDLYLSKDNHIIFNFGNIQIEQNGKIVQETKTYVRIKNSNGTIKKIYKNGKLQ